MDRRSELTYPDHLRLDRILDAQQPVSGAHDELLFIIQHQTSELWFRLILAEIDAARDRLAAQDFRGAGGRWRGWPGCCRISWRAGRCCACSTRWNSRPSAAISAPPRASSPGNTGWWNSRSAIGAPRCAIPDRNTGDRRATRCRTRPPLALSRRPAPARSRGRRGFPRRNLDARRALPAQ